MIIKRPEINIKELIRNDLKIQFIMEKQSGLKWRNSNSQCKL